MVRRHHRNNGFRAKPPRDCCSPIRDRDRGAAPLQFNDQVSRRYHSAQRAAKRIALIGRDQHEDPLFGNQWRRARNRFFKQRGLAVDREQRLRTPGAAFGPKSGATATGDYQRGGGGLTARANCHQTSAPSSLSLLSKSVRISSRVFPSCASKRITSAGCVFEARTSPHPPGNFTRAPSISIVS